MITIIWNALFHSVHNYLTNFVVPPVVIDGPMNRKKEKGNSVTFNCSANAEPAHFIEWDFNGQRVANSSKYVLSGANVSDTWMLTVVNVDLQDAGTYVCVAINEHGMANASAVLEVQGK